MHGPDNIQQSILAIYILGMNAPPKASNRPPKAFTICDFMSFSPNWRY